MVDPSEEADSPPGPLSPSVHLAFAIKLRHAARTSRWVRAVLAFASSAISIGLMTGAALATGAPLVFPSLGPTAYVLFDRPDSAAAKPTNVFAGHLVGVAAGYLSLVAFDLQHAPSMLQGNVSAGRVGATALALGLTAAAMVLFGCWHGPAGATTLIVSMGLLTNPAKLGVLMGAVTLLILQGVGLDKRGLGLPTWRPSRKQNRSSK